MLWRCVTDQGPYIHVAKDAAAVGLIVELQSAGVGLQQQPGSNYTRQPNHQPDVSVHVLQCCD